MHRILVVLGIVGALIGLWLRFAAPAALHDLREFGEGLFHTAVYVFAIGVVTSDIAGAIRSARNGSEK